jgi:vacuolar-type H+-ATPase subunit I/STV1
MDFEAWFAPPFPILLPIVPGILLIVFKVIGKMIGISYLEQESYGELLAEGSIEAFETLLSLPGNVFSYIRLLALALAHVSLMVAIRAMAGLIGGGSIISEIIIIIGLIFGNFIVILLEGLIVFLNALRLHFYEFFFKFYEGTGTEYKPFVIQDNYSNIKFQVEAEKDIISEEIEKEIDTKEIKEVVNNAKDYISEKYLE